MLDFYEELQEESFDALLQGSLSMEEYEERFMELIKYVPYLDIDQCHVEHFVYRINPRIWAQVQMCKPTLVVEVVKCTCIT